MLSRKHYEAIAKAIKHNNTHNHKGCNLIVKNKLIDDLCKYFANDNNLFDNTRFRSACYDD